MPPRARPPRLWRPPLVAALPVLLLAGLLATEPARAADSFNYDLTNATLAVVIDEHFHSEEKGKVSVVDSLRAYLGTATLQYLKHGGLNVEFYSLADVRLRPELTALLTVASCVDTWRLHKLVEEDGLLQFAVTDADCPRLPSHTAVTVPLTERGGDLPQMILDMKVERALDWPSAVVLHDHSVDSMLLDRLLSALTADTSGSMPSAISAFSIATEQADWKRRRRVESVLRSLPTGILGQRYLVLVSFDLVGVVMDVAKSLGLVHPLSQWMYVLGDTSRDSLATFSSLLAEGDNVAFASNYTTRSSTCQGGLLCHAHEMLRSFLVALDRSVQDEQDMATQVSDEEWEAIRPSKEDRMAMLLSHVKELLRSAGSCGNCTAWRLRSSDTWGLSYEKDAQSVTDGQGRGHDAGPPRPPGSPGPPGPPPEEQPADGPRGQGSQGQEQPHDDEEDVSRPGPPVETLLERLQGRLDALRSQPARNASRKGKWPRPRKAFVDPAWSSELDEEAGPEAEVGTAGLAEAGAPWPRRRSRAVERLDSAEEPDSVEAEEGSARGGRGGGRGDRGPRARGRLSAVGWWRPREGLVLSDALFPHAAHGFKGRNLPLVSFHNPPWQIITSNGSGHVVEYKGLVFEIINELAKNLNFTYTVLFPHQGEAGFTNDSDLYTSRAEGSEMYTAFSLNVSWDRMIQSVRDNKVFLGAGAFTETSERKQAVNFTRALSEQPYHFLVVRPRELSRAMLFTSPFTPTTWLCIALSVAAIGPVLHWVHCASPFYEYHGKRGGNGGLNSMTNCLWYAYGALLQQGGAYLPDADSGRLVVGAWWLVVLVLVTTYCGNLVAALTFPRLEASITSTQDLIESGDTLTWGFWRGSPLLEHLKSAPEPRLAPVLARAELHDDERDVLERVRRGTHVHIDWRVNLLQLMKRDFNQNGRCDFSIVTVQDFVQEKVAMIMSQENPYLAVINEELRRMQQVGLIDKWLRDYLPKKDRCSVGSSVLEANNHSVNLGDMQGSFFVLFFGFILAGLLILIECSWRRWHASKEKKVIKPFVP